MSGPRYSDREILRRMMHQWRSYWLHLLGIWCLSLLSVPFALLVPLPLKIAVDSYVGSEPLPGILRALVPGPQISGQSAILLLAVGLALALALLSQIVELAISLLGTYTQERMVLELRTRLFPHVQHLSLSYHVSKGTSDSVYRVLFDTSAVPGIFLAGVIPFATAFLTLVSMLVVTVRLSWQLALVAVAVAPVLLLISLTYKSRLRKASREVRELDSALMSQGQEVLFNVRIVKAFGKEESEKQRLVALAWEGMKARLRSKFGYGQMGLWNGLTTAAGGAAVLYIGMGQVSNGLLTLGSLLLVITYVARMYEPLRTILGGTASVQTYFASAERVLALLDEVPAVVERPHARPLRRARGEIRFENVTFAYEGSEPVIRDISFDVAPGTCVGIAGPTGAGKSTLVNLITRLYDPTEGRILLDGVDLGDYRLDDLRDQFAIVLQEPVLFSKSIRENIAYARPSASREEIVRAAELANVHDFIAGLPEGYHTAVGEQGMRLSGGERQRISLARAFLKDAPILILDEPTSSVDVRTEESIMQAMNRLMRDRTTFIIAHRLSTLGRCDCVFVVREGCLALLDVSNPDAILHALDGEGLLPEEQGRS